MVDVKTETKPVNPRTAIRESRQRRLRLISEGSGATVKVWPGSESMREVLRHPGRGIRFRDKLDQAVEWPNDSFTKRRIAEGSVRTDGPASGEQQPVDETLNARQQSAANKAQATKEDRPKVAPKNGKPARAEQQPEPQPAA